jgi:acetolactate synthase I/II/III large subunit
MKKVSDIIFDFVADCGVKHVFMLSGGGCMHLVDSLGSNNRLKYVCCHHEQAASIAAISYSQCTNNLGVALVTTGPGSTNAITGVAGAWAESVPLMIISGQVKRADLSGTSGIRMYGFQEVDCISCVTKITKYAITIMDPKDIVYHLEKAFYLAQTGRKGPVWIDVPLDVQASLIDETNLRSFIGSDEHRALQNEIPKISTTQLNEIVAMLEVSQRPVILAGNGIRLDLAENEFINLATKLNIPVLTTWKALDIIEDTNPLYCGRPGCVGQRGANFIQQNSDLIISIGARLDFGQIGYAHETFARAAKKIIVDIDESELKKFKFSVTQAVHASAKEFCASLLSMISNKNLPSYNSWWLRCREWKAKYPIVLEQYRKQEFRVSTYHLIEVLAAETSHTDVFVPGSSGACSDIFMQSFKIRKGQHVYNCPGIGSMGFGLPSTIGAAFATNKRIINVNGDGGFQLNIQDLDTIARYSLPIVFFILCNEAYGSIKTTQRNYFNNRYVGSDPSSGVTIPDMVKIANAYGIAAFTIERNQDVFEGVKRALKIKGPVLVEVKVDLNETVQPKLSSSVKPDGTIVSKPLEDLWPFLSRDEFMSNMIIPILDE